MENTNTNTTYVHWNVHHGFQIIIQFLLWVEGGEEVVWKGVVHELRTLVHKQALRDEEKMNVKVEHNK